MSKPAPGIWLVLASFASALQLAAIDGSVEGIVQWKLEETELDQTLWSSTHELDLADVGLSGPDRHDSHVPINAVGVLEVPAGTSQIAFQVRGCPVVLDSAASSSALLQSDAGGTKGGRGPKIDIFSLGLSSK